MKLGKKNAMTEGVIWRELLLFSIPLLIGNLFQQLYNTVDSFVVGNYVGEEALAAVGASTPLSNVIIGLFMGISTGAGILISRYYGAKLGEELHASVHTFIAFSLIVGVFLTFFGVFMSPIFLAWLKTPDNVMAPATLYMRIYFFGILGLVIYNSGAGILRAIGDSRHPLIYLIISSIINVVLDLLFVVEFGMGIEGVAIATLIAQLASAILVWVHLMRVQTNYRLVVRDIRIDFDKLIEIIRLGIPTGIQQTVVSFSNVLVQSYINVFGSAAVAGFSAANKYNSFLSMPTQSFALTITTFTGQNLGAKRKDRIMKGVHTSILLAAIIVIIIGIPTFMYADALIGLFSPVPAVIDYGARMLRIMVPFYALLSVTHIMSGALRGAGLTIVPMFIMIFCFTVLRQIFLFVVMRIDNSVDWVYWSYSFTWTVSMILTVIYSRNSNWLERA